MQRRETSSNETHNSLLIGWSWILRSYSSKTKQDFLKSRKFESHQNVLLKSVSILFNFSKKVFVREKIVKSLKRLLWFNLLSEHMGPLFLGHYFLLARISLRQFWLMHNRAWRWAINSASGLFTRLFNGCLSSEKRPGGRQLGSRLSYGSALKTITGESGILLMRLWATQEWPNNEWNDEEDEEEKEEKWQNPSW